MFIPSFLLLSKVQHPKKSLLTRARRTQAVGLLYDCWGVMASTSECRFKRLGTFTLSAPSPTSLKVCFGKKSSLRGNPRIVQCCFRSDPANCKGTVNLFLIFTCVFFLCYKNNS